MKKSMIPEFVPVQEESLFGDAHDITNVLDETRPADITVRSAGQGLAVSLDGGRTYSLIRRTELQGVDVTDRVQSWMTELPADLTD